MRKRGNRKKKTIN